MRVTEVEFENLKVKTPVTLLPHHLMSPAPDGGHTTLVFICSVIMTVRETNPPFFQPRLTRKQHDRIYSTATRT